jgi:hypothetical protein
LCERRARKRLLCSDLVRLSWSDPNGTRHAEVAVLENLSISGMGLFTGVNVPYASAIKIVANDASVTGSVRSCQFRQNGYIVGVELDAESKWAQEPNSGFRPEHLLDVSLLDLE